MIDILNNYILRPICSADDIKKISLGDASFLPLKIFLQRSALNFHHFEVAKTYVLLNEQLSTNRVWGYITLMNSEIVLNEGQRPSEPSASIKYEAFPAVKIARLAIDKSLQGKGFGSMMLEWSMSHVKLVIMPYVGCRFMVVDAKRSSVPFYEKSGFTLLNTTLNHNDEHPLMFLDLYKNFMTQSKVLRGTPVDIRIPNKTTLETLKKTDAGKSLVPCKNAKDMFDKLDL